MTKKFETCLGLNYSIQVHKKSATRVYRCHSCNKFFSNKTKKVVGTWRSDEEYKFACPHCLTTMLSTWSCDY